MTGSMENAGAICAINTVLYCRCFQRTLTFYQQTLGLRPGFRTDWFVEFEVAPGACLSVADDRRATVKAAAGAGITVTLRVADVRAFHAQLVARGESPPPVGARPWGAEGFLLRDPEGTRIEIWSPAGKAGREGPSSEQVQDDGQQ